MSAAPIDQDLVKLAAQVAADQSIIPTAQNLSALGETHSMWSEMIKFMPIGAAGMLSRILLSDKKITFWKAFAKVTAAGFVGCGVGLLAQEYLESPNLRYASVGIAGWFADKLMDLAGKYIDLKAKTASEPKE
jgi:hypothetical protein